MLIIIRFFRKRSLLLLFLLLEILAISLLLRNNAFQKSSAINSANKFTGNFYTKLQDVRGYLYLKEVNDSLVLKYNELLNSQKSSMQLDTNVVVMFDDSLYKQRYIYVAAKVVNVTTNFRNNYITINKGSNHGIKANMAVNGVNGVVGIVKEVSPNFATILSILNKNTSISAKIKKSDYSGRVTWAGTDINEVELSEIPEHAKFAKGDTVITSSYSAIFPEGFPIGTVSDFKIEDGNPNFEIKVNLFTDFKKLSYVFVVQDVYKAERDSLEGHLIYD